MSLRDVSTTLWRERQLLELLLFKLEEEQLLLAADRTRWLPFATREVEAVIDGIRDVEVARAAEVDAVARELGLPPGPSLRALAEAAPAPWGALLADHRAAFLALTEEVVHVASANRELLARGHQAAMDLLGTLGRAPDQPGTYSASGAAPRRSRPRLLDEAL